LRLFVQPEAQGAYHRNIGWSAFFIDNHLEDDCSLHMVGAGTGRILGLHLA